MKQEIINIFKTHLDIGFTDLAANVCKKYFNEFIINAINTASRFYEENNNRCYRWNVGSWLIYEQLERADNSQRKTVEDAILRGDIVWHALPFTMHSELATPALFRAGLDISNILDKRFGKKTIAAKMTDVPGHTRGIIAPLVNAGVELLHIGVNPASAVPDLPAVFRWEDSSGNSIVVIYQPDYGTAMQLPETNTIINVEVTGDNTGPHSFDEVESIYNNLEEMYPNSVIHTGSFNDIADIICRVKEKLPIIREEIGDTWIHGIGSDPLKVSRFKELCRLHSKWYNQNSISNKELEPFSINLLQVAEHTWGMDEKTWLPNDMRCMGQDFIELKESPEGKHFASSWQEQRDLIQTAVACLPAECKKIATARLKKLQPSKPILKDFVKTDKTQFQTEQFEIEFNLENGSINYLKQKVHNRVWTKPAGNLFSVFREDFSKNDYKRFIKQYLRDTPEWALLDFGKPFLPETISHKIIMPENTCLYHKKEHNCDCFSIHTILPATNNSPLKPFEIYLEYKFYDSAPIIDTDISWFNKSPERLPHAIWLSLGLLTEESGTWYMDKLGEMVSPLDVVSNGARNLHAINDNIVYQDTTDRLIITSLDAPLLAPEEPSLLNFTNRRLRMNKGGYFNLYNNIWGTNFPMWYSDDTKFRFRLEF